MTDKAPVSPYPRERGGWSSIPLPPYPEVRARETGTRSKDDDGDEGKSVRSDHLNVLAGYSSDNEADEEIEKEIEEDEPSGCAGERGDEGWMLVSTSAASTPEPEELVDGGVNEPSTLDTDQGTISRFKGYVTGAKTAVVDNLEGVREMVQKALPTLPSLLALPILFTLSALTTLPTLPNVPTLPAPPLFLTWRTKAQATRAEKKIQAQVWEENERNVTRFEEAIHGTIDPGITPVSTSTSVDKGQNEQTEIERESSCVREVAEEEEWKDNEGWDDFMS